MYSNIIRQNIYPTVKGSLRKLNRIFAMMLLFAVVFTAAHAQKKISDGTVTGGSALPDPNAIFELQSANKGLLLPRVALDTTTNPFPLQQPVAGLMVYNTALQKDVVPGYYICTGAIADGINTIWERNANVHISSPQLLSVTFYDDTTGVQLTTVTKPTPNGAFTYNDGAGINVTVGQANYPSGAFGHLAGYVYKNNIIDFFATNNATAGVDSIKKVGLGIYKLFFTPGTFSNANYSLAITSTDGQNVSWDDDWQTIAVPYMAAASPFNSGSALFNAAASEEGRNALYTRAGKICINLKTKNYCYIMTTWNATQYDVSYASLVFFPGPDNPNTDVPPNNTP
ncbi:MAG: hypothetical protein LBE82_09370 [Chitinophagaceae bacterium]|jgi:hypothetical protein|nr:hypothetical protein [Chitinophagaceae bacterium]